MFQSYHQQTLSTRFNTLQLHNFSHVHPDSGYLGIYVSICPFKYLLLLKKKKKKKKKKTTYAWL